MKIALLTDDSQCTIGLEVGGLGEVLYGILDISYFYEIETIVNFSESP